MKKGKATRIGRAAGKPVIGAIKAYQVLISSWMPPRCRFYPTCSQYMIQAIERLGVARGVAMGLRRICRCHPWNEGGYDPLPEG